MWWDWSSDLWRVIDREMDGMTVHDGTLSEATARAFRTETSHGRAVFTVVLSVLAVWFWRHITNFEYSHKASGGVHVRLGRANHRPGLGDDAPRGTLQGHVHD